MMANAFIRCSLLAVGLAGAFPLSSISADFAPGNHVTLGSKAASLAHCVRETGFMRRNHMELIKHQRDATVHQGIRETTDSLAGCIECHVSYDQQHQPVPVYSEGQFCRACHEFAAVDLPCFGCHATVPAYTDAEAQEEVQSQVGQREQADGGWASYSSAANAAIAHVPHEVGQEVGE